MTTQHHLPDHDPVDDLENTREHIGDEQPAITGAFPVVAERPAIDNPPSRGTRDDE